MKKTKSSLLFLFTVIFVLPILMIFSSCGAKKLTELEMEFPSNLVVIGGANNAIINKDYGDTTGLADIKVFAKYDDGSRKDITSSADLSYIISYLSNSVDASAINLSKNDYFNKVNSSSLETGHYEITMTFDGKSCNLSLNVGVVASTESFVLKIKDKTGFGLTENSIPYSASDQAFDIEVYKDNTKLTSDKYSEGLYTLKSGVTYDQNKSLLEYYYDDELVSFFPRSSIPGTYDVCVRVNATDNYSMTFTSLTKLTIVKTKIEVLDGLTLKYKFNADDSKYADLTFDEMAIGSSYGNKINYENVRVLINSDGIDSNNDVQEEKLTSEYINTMEYNTIGKFVATEIGKTYNAGTYDIKLKYVPSDKKDLHGGISYSDYWLESDEFTATLIVEKGEIYAPYVSAQFGTNGQALKVNNYGGHTLKVEGYFTNLKAETLENKLFVITSDNCTRNYSSQYNEYTFNANFAGNYSVNFEIISDNFVWKDTQNDVIGAYTKEINDKKSIKSFKFVIETQEFNQIFDNSQVLQSALFSDASTPMFNQNGVAQIRVGSNDDSLFENYDVEIAVLPVGTGLNGMTNNVTGSASLVANKQSRYFDFELAEDTPQDLTYVQVGFSITVKLKENKTSNVFTCNDGVAYGKDVYLCTLFKYSYLDSRFASNNVKSYGFDYNSHTYDGNYIVSDKTTYAEFIEALNGNDNGTWDIKIYDENGDIDIADMTQTIDYTKVYVLNYTSNKPYISSEMNFQIFIFTTTPSQEDILSRYGVSV